MSVSAKAFQASRPDELETAADAGHLGHAEFHQHAEDGREHDDLCERNKDVPQPAGQAPAITMSQIIQRVSENVTPVIPQADKHSDLSRVAGSR